MPLCALTALVGTSWVGRRFGRRFGVATSVISTSSRLNISNGWSYFCCTIHVYYWKSDAARVACRLQFGPHFPATFITVAILEFVLDAFRLQLAHESAGHATGHPSIYKNVAVSSFDEVNNEVLVDQPLGEGLLGVTVEVTDGALSHLTLWDFIVGWSIVDRHAACATDIITIFDPIVLKSRSGVREEEEQCEPRKSHV